MKRLLAMLIIVLQLLAFAGCSSNNSDYEDDFYADSGYDDGGYDDGSADDGGYDDGGQTQSDNDAQYISDRDIDFYKADNKYIAFFGLKNKAEQYISSSGKATIVIKDSNGRELYNKTLSFKEDDFSSWSNQYWSSSKYLCGLDISASGFPHCDSSTGTATMTVVLDDGSSFPESNMSIYDLPTHDWAYATCTQPKTCNGCGATTGQPDGHTFYSDGKCGDCGAVNPTVQQGISQCSLSLPSLPYSLHEYDYDDNIEYTFQVTDITYKFDVDNDGNVELDLYFSGTKSYDVDGAGQSDSCTISYKIFDASDNVVESGSFYSPSLAMGEKFSNKECSAIHSFDNVKPGAFRLEILSTNHR